MTFYAFIQKTCIWALSLAPFAYVSLTRMPGHGPDVTGASLMAIFHCMVVLGLCMYLAEQWCTLWDIQDAEDKPRVIYLESLRPSPKMTQADIAERIANGRFAEMSLHAAGMDE